MTGPSGGATGGLGPAGAGGGALLAAGGGLNTGGGSVGTGGQGEEPAAGGAAPNGTGGASGPAGGSSGTGGAQGTPGDTVTRASSHYEFRQYRSTVAENGVWSGPSVPSSEIVTTTFDTIVLENGFVKVTLLPEYGGRILSIVHKPSGKELLYQNPLGAPYLMGEGIFYYDYLIILGGIFPSFPEPEHGRYWNQPYEFSVVSETSEAITVRMARKDDKDRAIGVPSRYVVPRTDILVELDVTLRAGRSNVELSTKLTNTRAEPVSQFEYWTVTTLAPGSTPGDTKIPENTRILADMDRVHLYTSDWPWFEDAEEPVSGEIFEWNNLSYFTNWVDQGTAFANPKYEANWSGLVNYDSNIGTLRATEGGGTQGLKLWTFGKQSLDIDLNDPSEWLRPTIEMWHGVTPEFWNRGSMAASEVRAWKDYYFPTFGLREVSASSEFGAVQVSSEESGGEVTLRAVSTLTIPGQTVHALFRVGEAVTLEEDVLVPADGPLELVKKVPSSEVFPGVPFYVEFSQGEQSLLIGGITLP